MGACTDGRRPPPAPHVDVTLPVALIPADVDLVLRLDMRRFRDAMGPEPAETLAKLWRGFLLDTNGGVPDVAWMARTVNDTDSVWLGCRLGPRGCRDYVAVLRGRFSGAFETYGFGPIKNRRDLGGGWMSYDDPATRQRSGIGRAYFRPPEIVALVSPAELDSAERSIEMSLGTTDLVPREAGLVSVLVRSRPLADAMRERSRKAAEWLEASKRVEIDVEPQTHHTLLTFAVSFSDETEAERAAQAIKMLTDSLLHFERRIEPNDLEVQQLQADVVLRVRVRQRAADVE
jgi:hypothetical protein